MKNHFQSIYTLTILSLGTPLKNLLQYPIWKGEAFLVVLTLTILLPNDSFARVICLPSTAVGDVRIGPDLSIVYETKNYIYKHPNNTQSEQSFENIKSRIKEIHSKVNSFFDEKNVNIGLEPKSIEVIANADMVSPPVDFTGGIVGDSGRYIFNIAKQESRYVHIHWVRNINAENTYAVASDPSQTPYSHFNWIVIGLQNANWLVLAHELGHFFGDAAHSTIANSLMHTDPGTDISNELISKIWETANTKRTHLQSTTCRPETEEERQVRLCYEGCASGRDSCMREEPITPRLCIQMLRACQERCEVN